jgi:rhodanese-related sulfurtransferase
MTKSVAEMVKAAKSAIDNLTVDEAAREVEAGDAVLVDIREAEERTSAGAIPGAVPAPRGLLEFMADPDSPYHVDELRRDRRIILHCAGGGRSALAVLTLREMGYTDVAHMDGGLAAWKESGRALEGGQ